MPVHGFDHFNLTGSREQIEALRAFYCDVLGLAVGERPPFANSGYWLYLAGHPVLHLSMAGEGDARSDTIRGTFDHVAFACRDRAAIETDLARRGIAFRMAQVPRTGQVQLFLTDPAGNGVELNFAGMNA